MNDQDLQEVVEEFEDAFYEGGLGSHFISAGRHGEVFGFGNVAVKLSHLDKSPEETKEFKAKAVNEFSVACEMVALGYDVPEMYLLKSYDDQVAIFMERIDGEFDFFFDFNPLYQKIKTEGFIPVDIQGLREQKTQRMVLMDFSSWRYKD